MSNTTTKLTHALKSHHSLSVNLNDKEDVERFLSNLRAKSKMLQDDILTNNKCKSLANKDHLNSMLRKEIILIREDIEALKNCDALIEKITENQINEKAEQLVREDVWCNIDALMNDFVITHPDNIDNFHEEVQNYYSYPEMPAAEFWGGTEADRDGVIERLEAEKEKLEDEQRKIEDTVIKNHVGIEKNKSVSIRNPFMWDSKANHTIKWYGINDRILEVETIISDLEDLETEPQDVMEWWAISPWLYRKLDEIGCVVYNYGCTQVWGRTTSGQHISLDGEITQIARTLLTEGA